MEKLGNVLVGVDLGPGMEPVLQFAASQAKAASSQLTVLHVISPTEQEDRAHRPGISHFVDVMVEEVERKLTEMVDAIGVDGLEVHCTARVGDPVGEILKAAWDEANLLVIGMRRRSRVGKFLLGSNLQEILLAADLPVVVVPLDTDDRSVSAH